MASPRLLLALTVANVTLLGWQLVRPSRADSGEALGVLRGRGLELVDEAGRLRVQVSTDETRSVLHAEGAQTTLMLRSKAGVERVLGP